MCPYQKVGVDQGTNQEVEESRLHDKDSDDDWGIDQGKGEACCQ
jgi:hypothetical protein